MQITEEVKTYLNGQSFAMLCVEEDLGKGAEAMLLVKSDRDLVERLREADASPETGWIVDQTAHGPVLCMVLRAGDQAVGELAGELYFDPSDGSDRRLLGLLGRQSLVRVVFLDQDLQVAWMAEVPWDEVRRLIVDQVRDRAEELLERTEEYDFEKARDGFQATVSLDELAERAFPG